MWTLSGFADEISPDLDIQIEVLKSEGIRFLELRGVYGKNVLKLTDEELDNVAQKLEENGIGVSAIGSPIGKIKITDDFEPHLLEFKRAVYCAKKLKSPFIRLFSFFVPPEDAPKYRQKVLERTKALVEAAAGTGIVLAHENEKDIYGDIPERCLDLVESIADTNYKLVWDPANFVQCGVRPFTEGYEILRPHLAYVHVKDALLETKQVTLAGEGDGELRETIVALRDSNFTGFFSLEPHLRSAGVFAGFSGVDLFVKAVQSFKGLMREASVQWN